MPACPARKVVVGPGEIFDFGDELGPRPMHALRTNGDSKRLLHGGGTS